MGKFKVVYTDNIYKDNEIEYRRFAEAGYDFSVASSHDKETLKKECADADAVMLSFIEMDEELINSLQKCKVIVRCGMGFNNVDIPAATKRGIMVANVQKYCLAEVVCARISSSPLPKRTSLIWVAFPIVQGALEYMNTRKCSLLASTRSKFLADSSSRVNC